METQTERRIGVEVRTPVRITVPAKVAHNLDLFKKSVISLAERLGCPKCVSGRNCYFQLERDFVINENSRLQSEPLAHFGDPHPEPNLAATAKVNFASSAHYNLEGLLKATEELVGKLGHTQCISGFDISFEQLINPAVNPARVFDINANFKVNEFKFSV
jgi:hypothetical protein